ncbi:MAG: hypothetical protein AAF600_11925 [Bacteroidota bacterium]
MNKYRIVYGTETDDLGTGGEALLETKYILKINIPLNSFSKSSIQKIASGIYYFEYDDRYVRETVFLNTIISFSKKRRKTCLLSPAA